MKRKLLSILLVLCLAATLLPITALADESSQPVAKIGEKTFTSLSEAIQAATSENNTITLLADISLDAKLDVTKSVILDGGKTYTISAAEAFSSDSSSANACLIGITTQNVELTLKDVTIDARGKCRAVYLNKGKLIVDGATITGGRSGNYVGGVYVTNSASFEMQSGSITGNTVDSNYANDGYLQYSADLWIGANATGSVAAVKGGTIGNVFVNSNEYSANNPGSFQITAGTIENIYVEYDKGYGGAFTYTDGVIENLFISTKIGNGDCVKVTPEKGTEYQGGDVTVAKIGNTSYGTLAEVLTAAAASTDDVEIDLVCDCTLTPVTIADANGGKIALDMNGYNISFTLSEGENRAILLSQGDLTIRNSGAKGGIFAPADNVSLLETPLMAIALAGSSDSTAENYSVLTIGKNVTMKGYWYTVMVTPVDGNKAYGVVINVDGKIEGLSGGTYNASPLYINGSINQTTGNVPVINIHKDAILTSSLGTGDWPSGDSSSDGPAIYAAGYGKWNIEGQVNGGIYVKSGIVNISDGAIVLGSDVYSAPQGWGNGVHATGDAIVFDTYSGYAGQMELHVSGGTIYSPAGHALQEVPTDGKAVSGTVAIEISGENFGGGMRALQISDAFMRAVENNTVQLSITGGNYTSNPVAYLTADKTSVANKQTINGTTYYYSVTDIFDMPASIQRPYS